MASLVQAGPFCACHLDHHKRQQPLAISSLAEANIGLAEPERAQAQARGVAHLRQQPQEAQDGRFPPTTTTTTTTEAEGLAEAGDGRLEDVAGVGHHHQGAGRRRGGARHQERSV